MAHICYFRDSDPCNLRHIFTAAGCVYSLGGCASVTRHAHGWKISRSSVTQCLVAAEAAVTASLFIGYGSLIIGPVDDDADDWVGFRISREFYDDHFNLSELQ